MIVLAIDPGCDVSAWVLYDGARVLEHGIESNAVTLAVITDTFGKRKDVEVVLEQIESYGMAVGREVFETVFWTGRFYQRAQQFAPCCRLPRRDVKLHLCQSARAKDANVRRALLDRFGGEKAAKGSKAAPGPCYGLRKDLWAALGVAVTWYDLYQPTAQAVSL